MTEPVAKHALVFGASGVSGWAVVNAMLADYPVPGTWARVTALTHRPLSPADALWPADARLRIAAVDLLAGTQAELEHALTDAVPDIASVTHAYYLAYKASTDAAQERSDALAMFSRATTAADHLAPQLEFVVLQLGVKMYGVHLLGDFYFTPPLHEALPRLAPPHDTLFYHAQLDWLAAYAAGKRWAWCETRPDIIVGFVPRANYYSLATYLGIFLALFAAVRGAGAACPFPGSPRSWAARSNDTSADALARQTLFLSLHPERARGRAFNLADARAPQRWADKWPLLCGYFGLRGVPPGDDPPEVRRYLKDHAAEWAALEKAHGLRTGIAYSDHTYAGFEYFLLTQFDFDRQLDVSALREAGYTEEVGVMDAWGTVFDRMRQAKIIP